MSVDRAYAITGAGSGIGRATALRLRAAGAALVLNDVDADGLGETARQLEGDRLVQVVGDASDDSVVRRMFDECQRAFGRLDGVHANAGIIGSMNPILTLSAEDFERVLRVNLVGAFLAIRLGAERMQTGGSIVVTSSVAGIRAAAGPAPYSASKAALISLVQNAAFQLSGTGVRVNAVCPGLVETNMTRPLFELARAHGKADRIGQLNPLQRAGAPSEIAEVVQFLLSEESSYINGAAIVADGGLSAAHPFVPGKLW
jgi:NAD(P)-dependent dehydrogenase (short-subunit alcohol dehydrogenase family)